MKRSLVVLGLASSMAIAGGLAAATAAPKPALGRYIVVFKDSVANPAALAGRHANQLGAQISRTYANAIKGYAAALPAAALAALAGDPAVEMVVPDTVMHIDATTQTPATWGIDRIDQRSGTDNAFHYTATGTGVTAYMFDTGIRFSHQEFGGRATSGVDEIDGGSADDCNGHGTHTAGTVGGATVGVAKQVHLVAVRVLDCQGSGATSGIIAGLDWAVADHAGGTPAVANMSLGGGKNAALDAAVNRLINDGVTVSVSAGNGNDVTGSPADACNQSPARVAAAITNAATDRTDRAASFSNYGTCIDWYAPGVDVQSAWNGSDTQYQLDSGTSMSTPHTTGVAAEYLQLHPTATPAAVRTALFNLTTKNIVTHSSGGLFGQKKTPNHHLLFTNL